MTPVLGLVRLWWLPGFWPQGTRRILVRLGGQHHSLLLTAQEMWIYGKHSSAQVVMSTELPKPTAEQSQMTTKLLRCSRIPRDGCPRAAVAVPAVTQAGPWTPWAGEVSLPWQHTQSMIFLEHSPSWGPHQGPLQGRALGADTGGAPKGASNPRSDHRSALSSS